MKRSLEVAAPLLASTAIALLTGCHQQPEPQRCVDEQNHVVAASFCANQPQNLTGNQQNGYRSGFPIFLPYHYYYGGSGGFAPGSVVTGGSRTPLSGHSYSPSSSTTRGGFGSTFSGGGEGEGGGGHGSGGGE
jgi:hypothetical protein